METKMVQNSFGREIPMTREEFVKRWTAICSDFFKLAITTQDYNEINFIKQAVGEMASRKFDNIK